MDTTKIIDILYDIVIELDARDTSNNSVNMTNYSWDELCEMGINLFTQLKQ